MRHRSHTGAPVAREMPIRPPSADPRMLQGRPGPGRQVWQTGPAGRGVQRARWGAPQGVSPARRLARSPGAHTAPGRQPGRVRRDAGRPGPPGVRCHRPRGTRRLAARLAEAAVVHSPVTPANSIPGAAVLVFRDRTTFSSSCSPSRRPRRWQSGTRPCGHEGVDERGQHRAQIRRRGLQLVVQKPGRVDTARGGHHDVSFRSTVRGLPKDHAVAALCVYATPINRAGQYTTMPDTTPGSVHGSNRSPSTFLLNWVVSVAPMSRRGLIAERHAGPFDLHGSVLAAESGGTRASSGEISGPRALPDTEEEARYAVRRIVRVARPPGTPPWRQSRSGSSIPSWCHRCRPVNQRPVRREIR